jgi:phosphatidylglycerophosphatase A
MLDRIRLLLLSGFGAGLIPVAPGTWGTLVGTLAFFSTVGLSEPWQTGLLATWLLAACSLTIYLGDWAEGYLGGKDPQCCVLDEIAGILLTLLLFRGSGNSFLTAFWAFVMFRILDITKLPPARQAEKLPKGWGVLVDDLISGGYAAALLWGMRWLVPTWFGLP